MVELISKVITLSERKTSIRLAEAEWTALDEISKNENVKRNNIIDMINNNKDSNISLTCGIRMFIIVYLNQTLENHQLNYNLSTPEKNPILSAIKSIL